MAELLSVAVEIARAAGELLLTFFERRVRIEYKGDVDLITEADRASEKLIVERLRQHFPTDSIVAEEGGGKEQESEYRWYVDPLDGTTNFAHGFPVWCVSIGLERNGEGLAGVVYDPTREELFTAEKGRGALLNGHPISVSKTPELSQALVATGFPTRKRHKSPNIHFYYQVNMRSHGVRRAGSAALDLAYVAAGRMDAFWEFGLNPWDVAAGALLLREAGGRITDMKGQPHTLSSPHLLASNGLVHEALLEVFDEIFRGGFSYPLPTIEGSKV
jgi:myo-inositol-1(or 4)-monophosphatase